MPNPTKGPTGVVLKGLKQQGLAPSEIQQYTTERSVHMRKTYNKLCRGLEKRAAELYKHSRGMLVYIDSLVTKFLLYPSGLNPTLA